MLDDDTRTRAGGAWLALASVSMIAALTLHGPIAPQLADQMVRIGNRPLAWAVAHWLAAAALSFYPVAALLILTSRSNVPQGASSLSAWALVFVGSLWTLNTAVAEATTLADAAVAGQGDVFQAWWAYAEGNANGFAFLALAVSVIAAGDARSARRVTPAWAARTAVVAGVAAFTGWVLGMWFNIGPGTLLWLASSIVMSAWTAWFGVALFRSRASFVAGEAAPARTRTLAGVKAGIDA